MDLVESIDEIIENIMTLNSYLFDDRDYYNRDWAEERIRLGSNFVACRIEGRIMFYPTRFIGYKNNDMDRHSREYIDGRDTTNLMNKLFNGKCQTDILENEYLDFMAYLELKPTNKKRKYWDQILEIS